MLFSVLKTVFLFFLALFSFISSAKIFRSPYVMFEIEDTWSCRAFGVNWICHHYLRPDSKPAFILTTANIAGPSEKLDFDRFEKKETALSLLNPAKKVSIKNHVWIDSLRQDTFHKAVLSRHERTICCEDLPNKFQVLVGFHAFKEDYPSYAGSFLNAIKSLSLLTSNVEEIRRLIKKQTVQQKKDMDNYIQNILFENSAEAFPIKKQRHFTKSLLLLLFCLLVVGGAVYYYKRRPVKKRQKRRKK